LILNENVSGMNRFLFRELGTEFELVPRDVPYPASPRYRLALSSFSPDVKRWKKRHARATAAYLASTQCFSTRSRAAHAIVDEHADADLIFQIGGLFDGVSGPSSKPRVIFASFNTHLASVEWKPWAPFATDNDLIEWIALEREAYRSATCIVCTNRYVMTSFVRDYGVDPQRLAYVGYGVNFDAIPELNKSYTNNLALFVGYDFERKGGPAMVEAFRKVRREIPGARLRIIGPPSLDPQYQGDGVEFVPPLTDRDALLREFIEADFFVMPSVCEPFGLVFLEAMACGNACIGSFRNAMPEIITDGSSGYLVEPGDVVHLAQRMEGLYRDRNLARRMGEAARERVTREFLWPACGERVAQVFRALTGCGPRV
jgi:glycosyltransferase involved in cell wall biosynthesis